ncbi:kinase-like protein [Lentinus tigrinus ALCF2SS1-6]|uniref:non-specific serine/threonine protein kinase n=1 Tax=Lentinus tigrinus ALCF2SS1-6 TaxID=1328759 RepID=A0A5C2RYC0_9APHY|nr:kinase-like protein [Lentinus tigrinus ALCF2SS1-6]
MAATTSSPASRMPSTPAHTPSGSKPPAWALVDFRDDGPESEHDRQVSPLQATAPTAAATDVPVSLASSSQPPKMSSPQDFTFLKELGCGSWSTVMEAVHTGTDKRYAVKILSKAQLIKQKKVKYATVEKDALAKLSGTHPGIVKMYAAFQDETSLYFVLDLAPHGDLADLVKKYGSLSLQCARWYAAQIVDTILWIHSKGIVHRDMKPENVLLDSDMRIKLTDFGSAYLSPDGDLSPRASTFVGSAAYVSPELLNRSSKTTSNSSDIWAIGCTVFFMIAGSPPFAAINDYQSFRKIEALDYSFPEGFYDSAKDLVQRLVVLDPSDRLGVEPKSSPSQLREHTFFAALTDDPADTPIQWDTLWKDPPVSPETGIVQPSAAIADDDDEELWGNVVNEFSLVNLRSPPFGGPLDSLDPLDSGNSNSPAAPAPVDVPPVVPCEVVETVALDEPEPYQRRAAPPDNASDGGLVDPVLAAKDWSNVLSPGETIESIAAVTALVRKGLLKQPRLCALLLTSSPRILCVLLDEKGKEKPPKHSDVKQIMDLRTLGKKQGGVVASRTEQRRLMIQTGEKEHVYEFADQKAPALWTRKISALVAL